MRNSVIGRAYLGGAAAAAAGSSFEAETTTLIARFSVAPSSAKQTDMNTLIKALKDAGVWSKLAGVWVMGSCGTTAADANLNWKGTSYTLNPLNGMVLANTGYTASATGPKIAKTGIVAATSDPGGDLPWKDNIAFGTYCRTAGQLSQNCMGNDTFTGGTRIVLRNASDNCTVQLNDSGSDIMGTAGQVTTANAAFTIARSSNLKYATWAQVDLAPSGVSRTSVAPPAEELQIGGISGSVAIREYAAGWLGRYLNATERAAANAAFTAYMNARSIA